MLLSSCNFIRVAEFLQLQLLTSQHDVGTLPGLGWERHRRGTVNELHWCCFTGLGHGLYEPGLQDRGEPKKDSRCDQRFSSHQAGSKQKVCFIVLVQVSFPHPYPTPPPPSGLVCLKWLVNKLWCWCIVSLQMLTWLGEWPYAWIQMYVQDVLPIFGCFLVFCNHLSSEVMVKGWTCSQLVGCVGVVDVKKGSRLWLMMMDWFQVVVQVLQC